VSQRGDDEGSLMKVKRTKKKKKGWSTSLNVQLPLFDGLAHPLNHCFIILRRKKLLQIFFFNFFNILLLKINLKNIKNIIYIYIYVRTPLVFF
jgi:hypothetical protein